MNRFNLTLLIAGVCGAVAAAGFGVLAGTGLRVPARHEPVDQRVVVGTDEVFIASAPAYPSWAPEPLYPRDEQDPLATFAAAWDAAMSDPQVDPQSRVFQPPPDLPPPYEVRLEGEGRPTSPRPEQPRPAADGRYAYRGQPPVSEPVQPVEDDKSKS